MSDLFHEELSDEAIACVFGVMAITPRHTYQVLTKRSQRMRDWFRWLASQADDPFADVIGYADDYGNVVGAAFLRGLPDDNGPLGPWPLPNVWLGCSVEDQQRADQRIPDLLATPAAIRFVSYEPALGPVSFRSIPANLPGAGGDMVDALTGQQFYMDPGDATSLPPLAQLNWIIVGGESGPGARPFDIRWASAVVEQCRAADVACFVKQLGARPYASPEHDGATGGDLALSDRKGGDMAEWPHDLRVREFPRR